MTSLDKLTDDQIEKVAEALQRLSLAFGCTADEAVKAFADLQRKLSCHPMATIATLEEIAEENAEELQKLESADALRKVQERLRRNRGGGRRIEIE